MRLFTSLLVTLTAILAAGSSSALVTINHASSANGTSLNVGDTFTVTVNVVWDGEPGLNGIFSSTGYDASVLSLESAKFGTGSLAFRGSLFAGVDPNSTPTSLARFGGQDLRFASDPLSVIRTIQYGSLDAIDPSGAGNQLVTTLTFRALAPGTSGIAYVQAIADTGAQGNPTAIGTNVAVTVIPEPGTALLMGLGLAGRRS